MLFEMTQYLNTDLHQDLRVLSCAQGIASVYPNPSNTKGSSLLKILGKHLASKCFLIILHSVILLTEIVLKVMFHSSMASQGGK